MRIFFLQVISGYVQYILAPEMNNQYDDHNIASMEMIYGEGYLSAGADVEVAAIVEGLDLEGKLILDVGCGLGGELITLVKDHKAGHVHGIDIDTTVLERARWLVNREELADRITLTKTDPGPFPFDANQFDVVYATAVTCHFQTLEPFFKEVLRVLKPGGKLVGREWFKIADSQAYRDWDDMLRNRGLNFYFVDTDAFQSAMTQCGFTDVTIVDRTCVIAKLAMSAVSRVDNELKHNLITVLGIDGYQSCKNWTAIRAKALSDGGIGQGRFCASKG